MTEDLAGVQSVNPEERAEPDLDELRRLLAATTPGPWREEPMNPGWVLGAPDGVFERMVFRSGNPIAPVEQLHADAQFVAAARNALPALLDRLGEARTEAAQLRAENERLRGLFSGSQATNASAKGLAP